MYSYGSPHTAAQKQDDQHERTFSSYVRIQVVVLKTYLGRWTIGRSGERGSGISVLPARYDDDDDEGQTASIYKSIFMWVYIYIYTHTTKVPIISISIGIGICAFFWICYYGINHVALRIQEHPLAEILSNNSKKKETYEEVNKDRISLKLREIYKEQKVTLIRKKTPVEKVLISKMWKRKR